MKTLQNVRLAAVAAAMMLVGMSALAQAQTQTVTISAPKFAVLSFGSGVTLTVVAPTAGSDFAPVVSTGGTWSATTNTTAASVTAQLTGANALPAGMTLNASLTVPAGSGTGTAANLSSASAVAVASLTKSVISNSAATYTLTAPASAGWVASTALTVTYTVTAGT